MDSRETAHAESVPAPSHFSQLTPVVQAVDQHMACEQIQAEAKINNDRITDLATEQGWKVGQNVAAGVVGLVIWPVWFRMDFQDAAAIIAG